jgi:hypothetical protein
MRLAPMYCTPDPSQARDDCLLKMQKFAKSSNYGRLTGAPIQSENRSGGVRFECEYRKKPR